MPTKKKKIKVSVSNKYQLSSDNFGVHKKIISLVRESKKVLDVGCASGYLAKELLKKNCQIVGIEKEIEDAKKASNYCEDIIVGDIEDNSTIKLLKKRKFQIIILADVLEHLNQPEIVLNNLKNLLEKDGIMIISVPNIGFLTYRLNLLLGKFDYEDWGIMDRTHVRFFTKASILKLLDKTGIKLVKFDYIGNFTQLPLFMQTIYPLIGKRAWWRKIEYQFTGIWPQGLAVQFLLVCQNR